MGDQSMTETAIALALALATDIGFPGAQRYTAATALLALFGLVLE